MESLQGMGQPMRELQERFAALTEPLRPALWRYCLRLTGSVWDAEDLLQETLLKAFGRLNFYWQPLDPKPYLFRIATNAWIDIQRRARPATVEMEAAGELAAPATAVDQADQMAAMEELVGLLPPRQRVVLLLVDVFAFTAGEVAGMIGTTEGAVKAALHRARTTLRAHRASAGSEGEQRPTAPSSLVQRYLDAFNRRDVDGLAGLLHEGATCEIVGVATEIGREVIHRNSLRETFLEERPMQAITGRFAGEPVVGILFQTAGEWALGWVIRLDEEEGAITRMWSYFFTPELIAQCAADWGYPAISHGYRYIPQ